MAFYYGLEGLLELWAVYNCPANSGFIYAVTCDRRNLR